MNDINLDMNFAVNGETYESNQTLNQHIDATIQEIVNWFSITSHAMSGKDNRQRFVFSTKDKDYIMAHVSHPEHLSAKKEMDENGKLFCYTIDFLPEFRKSVEYARKQKISKGHQARNNNTNNNKG